MNLQLGDINSNLMYFISQNPSLIINNIQGMRIIGFKTKNRLILWVCNIIGIAEQKIIIKLSKNKSHKELLCTISTNNNGTLEEKQLYLDCNTYMIYNAKNIEFKNFMDPIWINNTQTYMPNLNLNHLFKEPNWNQDLQNIYNLFGKPVHLISCTDQLVFIYLGANSKHIGAAVIVVNKNNQIMEISALSTNQDFNFQINYNY